MFCSKCGSVVEEGTKFCKNCGNPVGESQAQPVSSQAGQALEANVQMQAAQPQTVQPQTVQPQAVQSQAAQPKAVQPQAEKSGKPWIKFVIIGGAVLVAAVAFVCVFFIGLGGPKNIKIRSLMKQAENCYSNKEYEDAVDKYSDVIDLDSEYADAYIGMAKAYMKLDDYESAADILNDGLDEIPDNDELGDLLTKVEKQLAEEEENADSSPAESHESSADPSGIADTVEPEENSDARYGKVLNIYAWNTEWITRLTDYYPDYIPNDYNDVAAGGWIGDVEVRFIIVTTSDNQYQDNLDINLLKNENAGADDKVDIFLVEPDYALKYVDSDYTLSMNEIGLSNSVFADQYQYTKDVVTDSNGNLKGSTWQCCPGALIYRADIAEAVLGTSDPDEVQEYVKDWETFQSTADMMGWYGYRMTATAYDTYRVFSNNITSKWVVDGVVNVDPNIKAWADMNKEMVDAGQTNTSTLWSDDWASGFYETGNVFCYFGPTWLIDFSMHSSEAGSVGYEGGWRVTEGPQGFYWGGTWICAATGTDNADLVADIIKTMTTDDTVLSQIIENNGDFVNDQKIIEAYADTSDFGDYILGGQNPLGIFSNNAARIDQSISSYDQGCNEAFQNVMNSYFDGWYYDYEEALDVFYTEVTAKYPGLSAPN